MKNRPAMVIIDAGQSGARAARALRDNGWDGELTLLGNEGVAPYDRPPLSKAVLPYPMKTMRICSGFSTTRGHFTAVLRAANRCR